MSNISFIDLSTTTNQSQSKLALYDSLTNKKRTFEPLEAGKVGMYVCGMTVYDYCHIGHARVMVAFDMIVRWLRQIGYNVTYVRNITDIDDKIISRANENNEAIGELTERFTKAMWEDAAAIGCLSPDHEPKATDYIDEMLKLIGTLEDKEHAYAASNGDVYYAVDTFENYGKLSKRKLDELQAGARIEVDTDKKNPFDFVLWKATKPDEPHWSSTWGNGRPGWHIECSAMSTDVLGDSFDIHGGGHDLQFPHHENEIAQSEAATGCTYANNWMHVGFINVDGEKMSKSLGNFFTIREVMNSFHPESIRFFILQSHYRSQVNFSDSALNDAHSGLSRLYQALKSAESYLNQADDSALLDSMSKIQTFEDVINVTNISEDLKKVVSKAVDEFSAAMNDDFNTPLAISVLFGLARELNKAVDAKRIEDVLVISGVVKALAAVLNIGQLNPTEFLQAQFGVVEEGQLSNDDIEALITERINAKKNKDFERADVIRDELQAVGIELEDNAQGTNWRRV